MLDETVDVDDYLQNQENFLCDSLRMFNVNIENKIMSTVYKIEKKFCKLHLQLVHFNEELINIKENENLILIIMGRITNLMKLLTKVVLEDRSNGDFIKLKEYLNINQIF